MEGEDMNVFFGIPCHVLVLVLYLLAMCYLRMFVHSGGSDVMLPVSVHTFWCAACF